MGTNYTMPADSLVDSNYDFMFMNGENSHAYKARLPWVIAATRNWRMIARDLVALDLDPLDPVQNDIRDRLRLLLRYCLGASYTFRRRFRAHPKFQNPEGMAALTPLLRESLGLMVDLYRLGENYLQPIPLQGPGGDKWLIPNNQPLELLVNATILKLGPGANLDDIKARMLQSSIVGLHRTGAKMPLVGLPRVIFICAEHRHSACSADVFGKLGNMQDAFDVRRTARFGDVNDMQVWQRHGAHGSLCQDVADRFDFVTNWYNVQSGKTYMGRAKESQLSNDEYTELCRNMYDAVGAPSDEGKPGGTPLPLKTGYNHRQELGRSFYAASDGSRVMFQEMSRCWKCRFVFHYRMYPGAGEQQTGPNAMVPEDPRQTAFKANESTTKFKCAEDLAHWLCVAASGGNCGRQGQDGEQFNFPPF
ncbi:uncharacterized protein B0I36DRAFT_349805 [Microdochium trichocladiopsis]|uniref:Uncharacterized protein n=1 Tax=Microdochium trichocladiopsis TaxID=1682393 RepID=A0A9P8Y5H8_9PEZI|nr:uncharacterized protein B0I36DRAFT_349805 [Microdochium trichocladiopsis]KAH7028813.1 hypothetical protein B0I36DRAFT_349805 [Microdochium trichocladiopsis]